MNIKVLRPSPTGLLAGACLALLSTSCMTPPALKAAAATAAQNKPGAAAVSLGDFSRTSPELIGEAAASAGTSGNSLDVPDGETAWGNPQATPELFAAVAKAGFELVRIPVTWSPHLGPAPDYAIEASWLDARGRGRGLRPLRRALLHHQRAPRRRRRLQGRRVDDAQRRRRQDDRRKQRRGASAVRGGVDADREVLRQPRRGADVRVDERDPRRLRQRPTRATTRSSTSSISSSSNLVRAQRRQQREAPPARPRLQHQHRPDDRGLQAADRPDARAG